MKPIKVFYSELSRKFYATRSYKEVRPGIFEVTGQKFDVTQDIARIIVEKNVTFTDVTDNPGAKALAAAEADNGTH